MFVTCQNSLSLAKKVCHLPKKSVTAKNFAISTSYVISSESCCQSCKCCCQAQKIQGPCRACNRKLHQPSSNKRRIGGDERNYHEDAATRNTNAINVKQGLRCSKGSKKESQPNGDRPGYVLAPSHSPLRSMPVKGPSCRAGQTAITSRRDQGRFLPRQSMLEAVT